MTIMPIIISITRTVIIMTLVIINILALLTNFVFIMKILIRIILITIILIQRRRQDYKSGECQSLSSCPAHFLSLHPEKLSLIYITAIIPVIILVINIF